MTNTIGARLNKISLIDCTLSNIVLFKLNKLLNKQYNPPVTQSVATSDLKNKTHLLTVLYYKTVLNLNKYFNCFH
jgi:hypothetical protein